jgi:DNA-binding response OmpR family regulator
MLNIIIVEDHKPLRESLVDLMATEGHHAAGFESAEALWSGCSFGTVDILVLDLNLPGEGGGAVAQRIRAQYPNIGIVMLTACNEPEDKRVGYENGADIYLAKPSSAMELAASVKALARRLKHNGSEKTELVLDTFAMTLSGPLDTVDLSASEVDLLVEFARSPNRRLETGTIADLDEREGEISKATIEVRIVRLRKKMIAAGAIGQPIKSIRNQGYQLSARMRIL